ncbi:hypothetical protein BDV25DRAFT_141325 [Aspergillus avenaceus]|uniref:Major facilitator superfamily domain-containing protein n=1 Tax=Aspergillus avenaceus TaxID=36643 RepID=A0A5N6TRI1_ASPAV|nr:hypothetical protein BDV25DRAFT_141325 [Aspergillus avenaceus]
MPTTLEITAISWVLISLGHTISAKDWTSLPQTRTLPNLASTCARAGWYQGSGFFLMNALINYTWAQDPSLLENPVNRVIAALMVGIVGVSSGWYFSRGVRGIGAVVGCMAVLQGGAVFGL